MDPIFLNVAFVWGTLSNDTVVIIVIEVLCVYCKLFVYLKNKASFRIHITDVRRSGLYMQHNIVLSA